MASETGSADDNSLLASEPDSPSLLADQAMLPVGPSLETIFGTKSAEWLRGPFMTGFAAVLQSVGVQVADDLMILTPQQAQGIPWSESQRPYTAPRNRLQGLLQQMTQEQRLTAVLHRFSANVSELLSLDEAGELAWTCTSVFAPYAVVCALCCARDTVVLGTSNHVCHVLSLMCAIS